MLCASTERALLSSLFSVQGYASAGKSITTYISVSGGSRSFFGGGGGGTTLKEKNV